MSDRFSSRYIQTKENNLKPFHLKMLFCLFFKMGFETMIQGDKVRVVQTLLFVEGINTLLQTLFGTRLPTVIGGSYAFMVPIISIIHDSSLSRIEDPHLVSKPIQMFNVFGFSTFPFVSKTCDQINCLFCYIMD